MIERADAVLVAVPLLAVSGLALRTAVVATGIGTGLLAVPLAPAGYLAALAVIVGELLGGPVAERAGDGDDRP